MNLLIDSALKATIILFAAFAASLALRRASADVRHIVWLAAILAVAVLPAALSIPSGAIPQGARIIVPALAARPQVAARKLPWLLILWAAGASIVLLRLVAGIASAARITRSARKVDGVLYTDRAATPMTWGFLRPVMILPSYAIEWTPAERDLVIRHERAHIERHDWLWQILSTAMTAAFWFHPLMWLAAIKLRREAEAAVDDRVLENGAAPADYAGRLLDVARQLHGFAAPASVIAMVRKPELESRVRSILDPSRRRASAGILVRCAIALSAVALILPIAVAHPQGKVYKARPGMTQPRILSKVEPVYPEDARDERIEGTVGLKAEITTEGIARNITVSKSLDPRFDANAVTAVSNWRFKPGTKDGEPVTVYVSIEITFHLK